MLDALVRWYASPPGDDAGLAIALEHAPRLLRPGSRLLVLADPASAGTIPAQRWSQLAMHHEVIVLLLIDPLERMPPHARLPFVAAGGGRIELGLDAEDTRQRWHREFSGSVDATLADLHARGIRAVELSCADPGDAWLPLLDRGGRSR